ncbi:MAG TPA: hypothetical protein VLZ06_03290 [Solirubrobacteraceae bacterium]|nr:hypothetical protein [Solirubrobacteraceae bacterium]
MERRIRIVGVCLLAAFALSTAVLTTSASASLEFGQCKKLLKGANNRYHGRWKNKDCVKREVVEGEEVKGEASPEEIGLGGKENKWEFVPGPAGNSTYSAKGHTVIITLPEAGGGLEITCKSSAGHGALKGAQSIEGNFSFKKCEQLKNNKLMCSTHGKDEGEIETAAHGLIGLLEEGKGPEKEPLIKYEYKEKGTEGNDEKPWMEFECQSKLYVVSGTLSGEAIDEANVPSKKAGISFTETLGQGLTASFEEQFGTETEESVATVTFGQSFKFETNYELRKQ